MKVVYPVFIVKSGRDQLVCVPDMEIYTEGKDFCDAIMMARDAIGSKVLALEDSGKGVPAASSIEMAKKRARQDADETVDYSKGVLTFVDVDIDSYRARIRNRSVKKNCTIPSWLNDKAESAGINFSRVLQEALIDIVGAN